MPCIEERTPDGVRIVCSRGWYGQNRERCTYCQRVSTRLCDGYVDTLTVCSRPMCWGHTFQPPGSKNVDLCPEHKTQQATSKAGSR